MRAVWVFLQVVALACGLAKAGEVVFPHVATGPHYGTELSLTNDDLSPATVSLVFYSPAGEQVEAFSPAQQLVIAPRDTVVVPLLRGASDVAGWAVARSSSAISGLLYISYYPSSDRQSSGSFDQLELVSAGRVNGVMGDPLRKAAVAICNPSTSRLNVDIDVFDASGAGIGTLSWNLPGLNQRALYLDQLGIPGAHSIELTSRSGLFSAISITQKGPEISANRVGGVLQKRFTMQEDKILLGFTPYEVRTRNGLALVTGPSGVTVVDLRSKSILALIPLAAETKKPEGERIALHPTKPLAAIAGTFETIIIDLNTFTVIKRFSLQRASVVFDDITDTFVTAERIELGLPWATKFTSYDPNFQQVATKSLTYGPGNPQARRGTLLVPTTPGTFYLLQLPSLQDSGLKFVPAGSTTYYARISGDNVVAFGPDDPFVSPAPNLLTLYYVDSNRFETIHLGEAVDTKALANGKVYLTRNDKLTVVDLLQRRIIYTSLLGFKPADLDFEADLNSLVAIELGGLRVFKISAQ